MTSVGKKKKKKKRQFQWNLKRNLSFFFFFFEGERDFFATFGKPGTVVVYSSIAGNKKLAHGRI